MADEQGEILSDKPTRSELALVARAARERWPIPEQTRRDLVDKLTTIALDKNQSTRTQLAATRALIAADRLNGQVERESHGSELFSGIALEAAQAGVTVQAIVQEMRKEPDYVRVAQSIVFSDFPGDLGLLDSKAQKSKPKKVRKRGYRPRTHGRTQS